MGNPPGPVQRRCPLARRLGLFGCRAADTSLIGPAACSRPSAHSPVPINDVPSVGGVIREARRSRLSIVTCLIPSRGQVADHPAPASSQGLRPLRPARLKHALRSSSDEDVLQILAQLIEQVHCN
jgi:hypothetical protein